MTGGVEDVAMEDDFALDFSHFGGDDGADVDAGFELRDEAVGCLVIVSAIRDGFLEPIEECDALIRSGRLAEVLEENDRAILRQRLGLSQRDCATLNAIWRKMRDRRFARSRATRKTT